MLPPWRSRAVSIPERVDDPSVSKASGMVELPLHISWSGTSRAYNLDDRRERALAYELVLQEGTEADVERLIDVDQLIDLWDELFLPRRVRREWAAWLREHRHLDLAR